MPRTTVNLPQNLLRQAKIEAAQRNVPMQQVIAEALKQKYRKLPIATRPFKIITGDLGTDKSTYRRKDIYKDIDARHL